VAVTEARSIKNALMAWAYRVEFNGYSPFLVQKFTLPKREFELSERGGGGQTLDVKQGGGEKVSEFTLECIVSAEGEERVFWQDWQDDVRTRNTDIYYRDGTTTLLGPSDEPNTIWDIEDAWPRLVEWEDFDSADKKKMVKIKVTMECNDCRQRVR